MSSENIATLLLRIESGRLFTYNKKRAGPSIDPCGTPEVTGRSRDVAPSTVTRWRLPQRNLSPVYTNRFFLDCTIIFIYIFTLIRLEGVLNLSLAGWGVSTKCLFG